MVDTHDQRPDELNPQPIPPGEERKRASPMIWFLLLLALLALGWWFFTQRAEQAAVTPPDATVTTEQPAVTGEPETGEAGQQAAQTGQTAAKREASKSSEEKRRAEQARRTAAKPKPKPSTDREVEPIARVQPTYPREALRARQEGTVLLSVDVDAAGNVSDVGFARRSGTRELDRAAADAVRKWKFRPAMADGKAVASTVQVPIDFKLADQ